MRVRFWGVRGSVPWATAVAIGHGCNTPCLEISNEEDGGLLILDAGSGIVGLGETLGTTPRAVSILFTHFHWDHLQGLPFFTPLYQEGWTTTLWGPALQTPAQSLVETIFQSPFFPVPYSQLPSPPSVRIIPPGDVTIDGFQVRAIRLNHPGGAFAYRIRGTNGNFVYATDHESGNETFDGPLREFAAGARALVFDAHFTPEEGADHRGWGHSTWAEAAAFAAAAGVERLWLFHHKPGRSDVDLMEIKSQARRIFSATDTAGEGDVFDV
jgi:phosphoribosyl 1,2-cyclic phosphodiesterase